MNSCLAYKRVTTIYGVGDGRVLFSCRRSANHEVLVVEFLIAHSMRVENFRLSAICRTSKSKCSVVERATSIAIQTAAIAGIPDDVSIGRYNYLKVELLTRNWRRTR